MKPEPKELPIGLLDPPAIDARIERNDAQLTELAENIRVNGIIQRLIVFPKGDRYEIVAGYSRFLAARLAHLVFVPVEVYPDQGAALEAVKYAENRFRRELSAAEEAKYFDDLLERDCGGDVDKLCAQLGEKRSYVEGRLNLFRGDPTIFEALANRDITIGVAQQLNKIPDELHRRYLLHQAKVGGATETVVRGWVMEWQRDHRATNGEPAPAIAASAPAPVPEMHYFTCCVCRGTDRVHQMTPVNVHTDCKSAILDKLLQTYHGDA